MSVRTAWRVPSVAGLALLAVTAVPAPAPAAARAADSGASVSASGSVSDSISVSASGSYRYWAFWEQDEKGGGWRYATQGPSVLRPADGSAVGFRFSLSENSEKAAKPRGESEFGEICDGTDAKGDGKRIAVRVDFGTPEHAPPGEKPPEPRQACARVGEDATAADALAEVAKPLRYNSDALLCAIDGYPKRGCGEQVADGAGDKGSGKGEEHEKDEKDEDGSGTSFGSAAGVATGLAVVAALAFAAVRRSRSR